MPHYYWLDSLMQQKTTIMEKFPSGCLFYYAVSLAVFLISWFSKAVFSNVVDFLIVSFANHDNFDYLNS